MTKRVPTKSEWADLRLGWKIAKSIGKMDIGQTVVVKNKCVLAVEAVERTNAALLRGGKFGGKNSVAIKTARSRQDMRMDVPGIGVETIRTMIRARISCLAIEAGKMLIVDLPATVKLAEKHRISIIAL